MKPNDLKVIDNSLGRIMLVLLRPIAFSIDKFLKWRKVWGGGGAPQKISIFKILGGGSLLIAYPAILGIRKRYPGSYIVLICATEVKVYAELTDLFDEIVTVRTNSIVQIAKSSFSALVSSFGSDIFVNYELHSKLSAVFALLSLSQERYGMYQDWNRWQERYINHPVFYNSGTPIYVGYEQLARKAGAEAVDWADACHRFQQGLGFACTSNERDGLVTIGVSAFCSALYKERQFSVEEFVAICRRHISAKTREIVILGGSSDQQHAARLAQAISQDQPNLLVTNLAGLTTLREVVKLFQHLSVLLSIDSGLNHLARLLAVPTITYWGPSDPNLRLKCIGHNEQVFYNKISCAPCVHLIDVPPCSGNNICMKQFLEPELIEKSNDGWEIL
jgi:ADP-heptose:LPS heptosyltransferase